MIERIEKKVAELTNLLKPLSELLSKATEIRLEDGDLVVPPLSAEEIPVSAINLRNQINLRLPKVGLVEIIQEVDGWTNYSKELYQNTIARNSDHGVKLKESTQTVAGRLGQPLCKFSNRLYVMIFYCQAFCNLTPKIYYHHQQNTFMSDVYHAFFHRCLSF